MYLYSGSSLPLTSDEHLLSISQASTQNLSLDAGVSNAGRKYWVFANFALNGTVPGVTLGSVNIPLNPVPWTQMTIDFANTAANRVLLREHEAVKSRATASNDAGTVTRTCWSSKGASCKYEGTEQTEPRGVISVMPHAWRIVRPCRS